MFTGYEEVTRREHDIRVRKANCYGWMVQRLADSRPTTRSRAAGRLAIAIAGVTLAAILAGAFGVTVGLASIPAPQELIARVSILDIT